MRTAASLLLVATCVALAPNAQAGVITVDANGGGDHATISEGIDAAASGDTVLVAPGLYAGPMNRDLALSGKELTITSSDGPAATIIDCEHAGRGFVLVLTGDISPTISGFTIRNGSALGARGGGIHAAHGSPMFADLIIENCHASVGGGMHCTAGTPTLDSVEFVANTADSLGGGLACEASGDATLTDVVFTGNECSSSAPRAIDGGGGMHVFWSTVSLTDVSFIGNRATVAGGGLCCDGTLSHSPTAATLISVAFEDNEAGYGGGMYLRGASASLGGIHFLSNSATADGGGLLIRDGVADVTLAEVRFHENTAAGDGGGVYVTETDPDVMVVTECEFLGNTAPDGYGGGAYVRNSSPVFAHSVFLENAALSGGGAMVHSYQSDALLDHCTFARNEATGEGSGVYAHTLASARLENSIVAFGGMSASVGCDFDATITLTCSDVFGNDGGDWVDCIASQSGTAGNLEADPLFCEDDPDDPLTLCAFSPCAPENSPSCGQIGARPVGCDVPSTGAEDAAAFDGPALRGNHPNPFNPKTTIAYDLPEPARVRLEIYDVAGRRVRTLIDGATVAAGLHAEPWDGRSDDGQQLASGVYLYRLEVDGGVLTKRMVLLK